MARILARAFLFVLALEITSIYCGVLPNYRQPKLSVVDWDNYYQRDEANPGAYAFGYDIEDPETNNIQTRDEERYPNGTVVGSYGYVQPDGSVLMVNYVADENGYRAKVSTIPRGALKATRTSANRRSNTFVQPNQNFNGGYESKFFPSRRTDIPYVYNNDYVEPRRQVVYYN